MCLAIPGKVVEIDREQGLLMGKVDFGGVSKSVCLEHVPEVCLGEYVLVHVGFAIGRIDEAEANEIYELIGKPGEIEETDRP